MRGARRGRVAKLLLAGVLFVGLFIHIGMLAGISGETKRADALGREMVELSAQRDNLEVSPLDAEKTPERIAQLAAQMGMQRPGQDAIRVVSPARRAGRRTNADRRIARRGRSGSVNFKAGRDAVGSHGPDRPSPPCGVSGCLFYPLSRADGAAFLSTGHRRGGSAAPRAGAVDQRIGHRPHARRHLRPQRARPWP